MNVTNTGIAVALAIVVVLGFFLFGFTNPFTPSAMPEDSGSALGAFTNNEESMITDTVVGTGAEVKRGDTVSVNYVGTFEDGTKFDASADHGGPFTFTLGVDPVIQGWEQGLVGMKVGGKRHLVIPPELGYGANDYGPIPGGSTLIFDIELVSVQ